MEAGEGSRGATHADASLATAGAILVAQWAHNLIAGIGDGEGRGKRRPGRHIGIELPTPPCNALSCQGVEGAAAGEVLLIGTVGMIKRSIR